MIKLSEVTTLDLIPTTPFHFASTFYKPGHFPSTDTRWDEHRRWQTMRWQGEILGLIFEDAGTANAPKVKVTIHSETPPTSQFMADLSQELVWRYNLSLDLGSFYQEVGSDPVLYEPIRRFSGLRPMHPGSLYEYLVIAIVLQNTTVRRTVSMMQTLFERFGTPVEFDGQQFWAFWEPAALASADEQELRRLKLGYRAKSLIRVSKPFAERSIDDLVLRDTSQAEQEHTLRSLYGIGPASVGYIMFDVFHHWDYLKHISPWEHKIYTRLFFQKDYETDLVPVSEMLSYFEKWGVWKGLAIHYAWENIWWKRRNEHIPWLEQLIRL